MTFIVNTDAALHNDTLMPNLSSYFRRNADDTGYEMNQQISPDRTIEEWMSCDSATVGIACAGVGRHHDQTIGRTVLEMRNLRSRLADLSEHDTKMRDEAQNAISIIGRRLIQESETRNWCQEFDQIIDDVNDALPSWLQLPNREHEYLVSWTEEYTVTVSRSTTVIARNEDDALELVDSDQEADAYDISEAVSMGNYEYSTTNNDHEAELA